MPVTPSTTTSGTLVTNGGLYPQSITVAVNESGVNNIGVVGITWMAVVGISVGFDDYYLESAQYDGIDMTFLAYNSASAVNNHAYYKTGLSGAKNVVATWNSDTGILVITAALNFTSYTAVDQTTPFAQSGTATGSTSPITKTLTTASANNYLVDMAMHYRDNTASVPTISAGQTERQKVDVGTLTARHVALMSDKAATAASQTMSWTQSINRPWATIVGELAAAATTAIQDPIMSGSVIPFPR